jgi:hypothetical protein
MARFALTRRQIRIFDDVTVKISCSALSSSSSCVPFASHPARQVILLDDEQASLLGIKIASIMKVVSPPFAVTMKT